MEIKRHEVWRVQYRGRRYMEHLNAEELAQRFRDVFLNLTRVNNKGLVEPITSGRWMELFTHLLEEYVLRGKEIPTLGKKQAGFPWETARARAAVERVKERRDIFSGVCLFKYGTAKNMRAAFDHGELYVSPASRFKDTTLLPAVQDNELELFVETLPSETTIRKVDRATGEAVGPEIRPISNARITFTTWDHYVYCVSTKFDYRLFDDFAAECCLFIKDIDLFFHRVSTALATTRPDLAGSSQLVEYIDPLNRRGPEPDVLFGKHFRYAYQQECRLVLLPEPRSARLQPFKLYIGSMSSFAELICL